MAGRYKIELLPSAVRELESLPREAQARVADRREVYNATAIRRLLGRLRGTA